MNDAERLFRDLNAKFQSDQNILIPPKYSDGFWTVEINSNENSICVEWSEDNIFSVSSYGGLSFGEKLDESYTNYLDVLNRCSEFLEGRASSSPPHHLTLGQIRERRGDKQSDIAAVLQVKQPTISALERRGDFQISTLCRYVASMGGEIIIQAVFSNEKYALKIDLNDNELYHNLNMRNKNKIDRVQVPNDTQFAALNASGDLARANDIALKIRERGSILELSV